MRPAARDWARGRRYVTCAAIDAAGRSARDARTSSCFIEAHMKKDRTPAGKRGSAGQPSPPSRRGRKVRTPTENVKHVVDTWLPPGIEVEDAKDPGAHAPGGPVENRS